MTRSVKLPIYKDGTAKEHRLFRRRIKRLIRQKVRDIKNLKDPELYEIPNPKSLVNDYDWCDYIFDMRTINLIRPSYSNKTDEDWVKWQVDTQKKLSRK